MRLSRPLVLVLTLILSTSSAPAEDIAGTVRSYDQAARTLTLKPDGSTKEIRLLVPQGAIVRGNGAGAPPVPEISPGTQVLVREQPVVAEMLVQDAVVGTIKSVDHEALTFNRSASAKPWGRRQDGDRVQASMKELVVGHARSRSSRDPSTTTGTPIAERPVRPEENQGTLRKPPGEMGVLLIALGISELNRSL